MLFDVTRSDLADIFGEDRLATLPATAFPPSTADTEGARLLQTVGVPTGTLWLREPDEDTGRLPLVQDVVDAEDFEGASEEAGEWPVIGWLLNAHLAFDPASGKVYAFDADEETVQELTRTSPPSSRSPSGSSACSRSSPSAATTATRKPTSSAWTARSIESVRRRAASTRAPSRTTRPSGP